MIQSKYYAQRFTQLVQLNETTEINKKDVQIENSDHIRSQSIPLKSLRGLTGVGHRWIVQRRLVGNEKTHLLMVDAGTSEPSCYLMPTWMSSRRESGGVKVTRRPCQVQLKDFPSWKSNHPGQRRDRVCHLRPRSPYTGQGVLDLSVIYPKLKSTKTSKK